MAMAGMEGYEWVLYEDGKRIDSVDPIWDYGETDTHWWVEGVMSTYVFEKKPSRTFKIEKMQTVEYQTNTTPQI